MARIVFGSCMVRYPLGGMLSCVLQWLVGLQRLGHDVYFVEKAGYDNACFDPVRGVMSDDCSFGVEAVRALLARHGMAERFCFVDRGGTCYGLARDTIEKVFRTADAFLDMGSHGAWLEESSEAGIRVLIDGEPGYTQIRMTKAQWGGAPVSGYDLYYSNGANIGSARSPAPDAGLSWRQVYNPVVIDEFPVVPVPPDAAFTTVMNWQSHDPITYNGTAYGQKDVEFERFIALPTRTAARLEVAVAGHVPHARLAAGRWSVVDAIWATRSYDSFRDYIRGSCGEFSVCKNVFVALRTGWFSDKSAAFLATGRPVILQDTGFSAHLPCGLGLFAVGDVDEAAAALDEILRTPEVHAAAAREIAREHLDARRTLTRFLGEIGL